MRLVSQSPIVKYLRDLVAFVAGAVTPLCFKPMQIWWLALLTPGILLFVLGTTSPKRALLRGFLFGFGEFLVGVSWVYVSIHTFGGLNAFLAGLFTLAFISVLSLCPALMSYLYVKIFANIHAVISIVGFACLWSLKDWLRSVLFSGFPWNLLAYSQVKSPLSGFIPIIGNFGVTFLLVLLSASFYFMLIAIAKKNMKVMMILLLTIIGILGTGFYLQRITWTLPRDKTFSVALIQGNIAQSLKWDENQILPTIETYINLTRPFWKSNIIVWPEAAIPVPLPQAGPLIKNLNTKAKLEGSSLLVGIPVQADNQFFYYNALVALGQAKGRYYKRHLVPFGEYTPFTNVLGNFMQFLEIPMSNMIAGQMKQPLITVNGDKVGVYICYEIAFSSVVRTDLPEANFLITISDDSWFGDSFAPEQHVQIAQFRALQTGREMLFVSNSGVTAIINSKGRIIKQLPMFTREVLRGEVQSRTGKTWWVKYGDLPVILLIFFILLIIAVIALLLKSVRSPQ